MCTIPWTALKIWHISLAVALAFPFALALARRGDSPPATRASLRARAHGRAPVGDRDAALQRASPRTAAPAQPPRSGVALRAGRGA